MTTTDTTIGINGMAHVILTVSQFAAARAFLQAFARPGHDAGLRHRQVVLLRRRSDSDRHPASRSGA